MDINLLPPVSIPSGRTATSNPIQSLAEAHVHRDMRQPPTPPVSETEAEMRGNGHDPERKLAWDSEAETPVFRVVDGESGDVICQLPSEEVLRVSQRIGEQLRDEGETLDVRS